MQADHRNTTAETRSRFRSAAIAICAAWPLLLPAAEPARPDASAPKRIRFVPAQYPRLPLSHGIEGAVTLRFTVLPDGSTADIEIVNTFSTDPFEDRAIQAISNSLFEENAIRALQQWYANPFADFDTTRLYRYLREHGVAKPAQPSFRYSDLGFGLLGQALVNLENTDYPALVRRSVLEPLGMRETSISLDANQQRRVIPGYDATCRLARAWDVTALAGAGGLRSTVADMLTYLEAHLRQRPADGAATAEGRTLAAALVRSQALQSDAAQARRIAYAWAYDTATETYSHDGGTGGYSSYAFFSPKRNYAGVVLVNLASTTRGNFAVVVGKHIAARVAGDAAASVQDE